MKQPSAVTFEAEIKPFLATATPSTIDDLLAIQAAISKGEQVSILIPDAGGSQAWDVVAKTANCRKWEQHMNPDGFYDSL